MRVGITGHQHRSGLDWAWTSTTLDRLLDEQPEPLVGFSSLAAGADQLFAHAVLARGGHHVAIIPLDNYERCFNQLADLAAYRQFLARSEVVRLAHPGPDEEAFFTAGRHVAEQSDLLIAIWDGRPAKGRGGTADI